MQAEIFHYVCHHRINTRWILLSVLQFFDAVFCFVEELEVCFNFKEMWIHKWTSIGKGLNTNDI
jgi:hypothetical protein